MQKFALPTLLLIVLTACTASAAFYDVSANHQNADAINYVQENNIVEGYSNGSYKPDALINRAEFTKIIIGATLESNEISGSDCFPDVQSEWFAKYVCTAKNKGVIAGFPNGEFRPEQNISFVEAAKIISNAFGYPAETSSVWYQPFVENLSDRSAIPTTITAFESQITRGGMAEMIYRLKANVTHKSSQTWSSLSSISSDSYQSNFTLEAWADNWFAVYLGESLLVEDSVSITTERSFNSESTSFTALYPLHLNFILKDFKENNTGLEYIGTFKQQMGDGGFIMQVTDNKTGQVVGVSNSNMKCMVIHEAPSGKSCAQESNPVAGQGACGYTSLSEPSGWKQVSFNDSTWSSATVHSSQAVQPKEGYNQISWDSSAQFIWGPDLETANTILCRMTIAAPANAQGSSFVSSASCLGKDAAFAPFADTLNVYCDDTYMYIEADSLSDDIMMVGITAWNHQVPTPQAFVSSNAWRIPLYPQRLSTPVATVGQGPIGVAINGVMIYNPTKQDGIYTQDGDPFLIGELGVCGGHSGRADDYHYHTAPNCILDEVGAQYSLPIGYALDGYPIYGYTNADGSMPDLDECGGEYDANGDYHYHATKEYPYVNGCFMGKFDMSLQPHTEAARDPNPLGHSQQVLITRMDYVKNGVSEMDYTHRGTSYTIRYEQSGNCYDFAFIQGGQVIKTQKYCVSGSSAGQSGNTDTTGTSPGNSNRPPPGNSPNDGGQRLYCGDGICDNTESSSQCPADC